jgi:hypothetical protein
MYRCYLFFAISLKEKKSILEFFFGFCRGKIISNQKKNSTASTVNAVYRLIFFHSTCGKLSHALKK